MESYITISSLNDFIFCPKSIYYHGLYNTFSKEIFLQKPQIDGNHAHKTIDEKNYSTRKSILQSIDVYSEKYGICGKIDVFDSVSGKLTERKKNIVKIYDGYIFQVYAQCVCLIEMGFTVNEIVIHDLSKNKNYSIPLPTVDNEMFEKFEETIIKMKQYAVEEPLLNINPEKCKKCIYSNLCDQSLC